MAATFPFATYRTGQREAIDAVRDAFARGRRFVVVEAPTGAGKSAIAVTVAREIGDGYVLTAQKILQDQYARDFPDLALMKGRANYDCLVAPTHAAAAPCIVGRRFPQCDACPYFTAKDLALGADTVITNYAYYLAELNYAKGLGARELLVLDEAHGAEAALMSFVEVTIADEAMARAGIDARIPGLADRTGMFDFAEDLEPVLRSRAEEIGRELEAGGTSERETLRLIQQKQWCDQLATRLEQLCDSRYEDFVEWTVETRHVDGGAVVTFKPVTVASFAERYLFGHARRVLMMSATILDPATYLRSLGIPEGEAEVIRMPSTFPPRNRPIHLRPVARLTRHWLERDLPRLVAELDQILDAHPDDKGVIHAHSYRITAHIARHVADRHRERLVTHRSSEGRDDALRRHVDSDRPTVLLTPSMTEGIDLAGDLSRWQVICKIPYPYLGDAQIAARAERDSDWYDWRTCLTIVQGYGRSVRSDDDWAVTYILDADFPKFYARQRARFPEWFREAVQD